MTPGKCAFLMQVLSARNSPGENKNKERSRERKEGEGEVKKTIRLGGGAPS